MFKMGDYLIHYGVKGMKWGVRRYQPYSVRGRLGGRTGRYVGQYKPNTRNSSSSARSTRNVRQSNAKKVLKGAAIVAGSAVVAVGAYKMSKYFKTPEGRRKLNKGVEWTKEKLINANYNTRNAVRVVRTATRVPRTALRSLPGGKAAVATLGVASTVSDINTTRKWAQKTHKQGKVTKKDVKDFAIDLANPIPDNIPGLNRKKRIAHSDVLIHYGVKGMKWGVRHDRNSYSRRDKRKERGLSDRQKRALKIGASVVAAGLLAYGLYKLNRKGFINKSIIADSYGSNSIRGIIGRSRKAIARSMVSNINKPSSKEFTEILGRQRNCVSCSTSYLLNSLFGKNTTALPYHGVDEVSGMVDSFGRDPRVLRGVFDGIKETPLPEGSTISKSVGKISNSSTGMLCVKNTRNGARHVLNYEKDVNGITTIVDAQVDYIMDSRNHNWGSYEVIKIMDFSEATLKDNAENVLKYLVK